MNFNGIDFGDANVDIQIFESGFPQMYVLVENYRNGDIITSLRKMEEIENQFNFDVDFDSPTFQGYKFEDGWGEEIHVSPDYNNISNTVLLTRGISSGPITESIPVENVEMLYGEHVAAEIEDLTR